MVLAVTKQGKTGSTAHAKEHSFSGEIPEDLRTLHGEERIWEDRKLSRDKIPWNLSSKATFSFRGTETCSVQNLMIHYRIPSTPLPCSVDQTYILELNAAILSFRYTGVLFRLETQSRGKESLNVPTVLLP